MRKSSASGGAPWWKLTISSSVPHTPTSSVRTRTSVGERRRGSGASVMTRTSRDFGKTATAFMVLLLDGASLRGPR